MFINFFYLLRAYKIPVAITEWMMLMRALKNGLIASNLNRFYTIAKAILIKNESFYDIFDQCFLHFFKDAATPQPIDDNIRDWLNRTPLERFFSPEELAALKKLSLEELNKLFEERLKEQKEAHNGGNRWIGTGGTSPFGHGGQNPAGIRVGGAGGGRSAVKVAGERRFRNYRHDLTLDVRQIKVALKELRELKRVGLKDELDMDATIDKTCRNFGEIELVFKAPRKNQTKLILMMDVGGTMDPYADLVSLLFSAAHASNHFKDFKFYYFHNCVYSQVYSDMERRKAIPTADLFRKFNSDYKLVMVGDAWMSPYELFYNYGAIAFDSNESRAGLNWLKELKSHFPKAVWLNPEKLDYWGAETITAVRQVFKMFPLTLDGLKDAVAVL